MQLLRRPWTIVAFLWTAYLMNYVDRQVVFSILPVLERELGFTPTQLGLIGSIFIWVYSLCSPLAGRLADRVRLDRLIPASLLLWSLATLATGLSRSVEALLFWRGVIGVTEGLYFPAALAAIGAAHPGPTRSRAISIHGSAQFAGIVAGGWFGGWTAQTVGWRWGFVALAILGLLYAPGLRMGMKNLPPRDSSASTAARPAQVLGGRCFQALALAFFSVCAMLWILYAWLPSLIYERYRLSLADSGFTATVWLQASSAAGILSGGVLADWLSRRMAAGRFYVVAAGLLLCSPFAYLSLAAPSLDGLKFACAAFGLFAGVMLSNVVAAAYDVTGPENYGFSAGALTLIGGLAGGLGILSMGRWKASLGAGTLMGWAAAAGVVSALALAWVVAARFRFERYQRPSAKE